MPFVSYTVLKFEIKFFFRLAVASSRRIRGGAPFIAMPPFRWTMRDRGDGVRYIVDSRSYLVDRTVSGNRRSQKIELLRCEEFFEANCVAFAYKYQGYIYVYGYHNHY